MRQLSRRVDRLGTENAFVVLAEVQELLRSGRPVLSFCIGQPDFATPENIRRAGINAIEGGKTGYTPSAGIAELREAIARSLSASRGIDVRPEDVVVGAGAKCFIGYTILSTTDPGEGHEVIFPVPGFPIYESQIKVSGAVPVPLILREDRGFALDPDDIERAITPKTRLLILNDPHNPTGAVTDPKTMAKVADVLRRHEHVWIYSDEVYSRLVYDGTFSSVASFGLAERTIVVDGASKTWAMPGWRIGWAANRALAPTLTRWVTNFESCAGSMNQAAALEAVSGPQDEADRMKASFHARRDLIVRLLEGVPGVRCARPDGAFYAWANVDEACRMVGAADSEELRKRLLYEADVAVLADQHFGPRGPGQHLRFSYAASPAAIEEGLARFAAFVKRATK